jgi:hypothetical protein
MKSELKAWRGVNLKIMTKTEVLVNSRWTDAAIHIKHIFVYTESDVLTKNSGV